MVVAGCIECRALLVLWIRVIVGVCGRGLCGCAHGLLWGGFVWCWRSRVVVWLCAWWVVDEVQLGGGVGVTLV